MSQEFQHQHSMKGETVEIELEPRPAAQASTAPEARNDTAELRSPQAGIDNDQAFSMKSSEEAGVTTSRSARSSSSLSLPRHLRHEEEADVGAQNDQSQNDNDESFNLLHLDDRILLFSIKGHVLSRLGYKADGSPIRSAEPRASRFGIGVGTEEIAKLFRQSGKQISDAWPKTRNIEGVEQFIIKDDDGRFKVETPWLTWREETDHYAAFESMWFDWCYKARNKEKNRSSTLSRFDKDPTRGKIVYCRSNKFQKGFQSFPISLIACAFSFEKPFGFPHGEWDNSGVWYSASFLTTNFRGGYSIQTDHLHNEIHWQMRYFSPMEKTTYNPINCLLSKRQTATIHHQSRKVNFQERRARVSLRILKEAPEIFSVLVLTDDDTSPNPYNLDGEFGGRTVWNGMSYSERDIMDPITHFTLHICRVLKFAMESWGETLDSIDQLVHITLEDLDSQKKVEELMFDNSFKRSRDYFVALQLLRIIDEWLDEACLSVQDMTGSQKLEDIIVRMRDSRDSFNRRAVQTDPFHMTHAFIQNHVASVKIRVRDKKEEINSLRDGLFNATSLRESTKAMTLNQAIYVFTVVTVLFTPVSFLATFWALPFLNNPTEGTDVVPVPSAFRNSFIIMPLLTYALVIGVAWFVGKRNSVDTVLSMLTELGQSAIQLLKSWWDLLKEKSKNRNGGSPFP